MRDYEELVNSLKNCMNIPCNEEEKEKCLAGKERDCRRELMAIATYAIEELVSNADKFKWISVEEPPDNDRNIFICHGSVDFKAPCIGHYDSGMKMFYEDKNWFASPIYDAMFWCEMPKLPMSESPKED